MLRRSFDISLAALGLLLTAPILLVAVLVIRVASPGPVIYRATRVGLNGRYFCLYKLRTMHAKSAGAKTSVITAAHDPRVFSIGARLRRWKVDELPQLLNVIKGDMSIVGPRPEDPAIVSSHYGPRAWETLTVRPGLTSPGSLYYITHGERHLLAPDFERYYIDSLLPLKLKLDLIYVGNASLAYDVRLVLRTIWIVVATSLGQTNFAEPHELKKLNSLEGAGAVQTRPGMSLRT